MEQGLEAALVATEEQVDAALKAAAALTRNLRRAKTNASRGEVRDLRRSLDALAASAEDAADAARSASASFELDVRELLESGAYTKELVDAAAANDVTMLEADDRLLCYPSLIKLVPGDSAVEIDRRREKRLRPSVLVRLLAEAQSRPPKFRPEPFLESLASGYDLVRARDDLPDGKVVKLVDVWHVLTLLPGQRSDYTRPEFARDLYLLDHNGHARSRSGRVLRWSASTGTRGPGVLTTVAQSGQQQRYWGVSFVAPS